MPSPTNVAEFAESCIAWWRGIQPSWRGDTLSREVPSNADWSGVLCGGPTGIVLVLLALAWWMNTCDGRNLPDERLLGLISEVWWTLVEMRNHLAGKRRHGDEQETDVGKPARKR